MHWHCLSYSMVSVIAKNLKDRRQYKGEKSYLSNNSIYKLHGLFLFRFENLKCWIIPLVSFCSRRSHLSFWSFKSGPLPCSYERRKFISFYQPEERKDFSGLSWSGSLSAAQWTYLFSTHFSIKKNFSKGSPKVSFLETSSRPPPSNYYFISVFVWTTNLFCQWILNNMEVDM